MEIDLNQNHAVNEVEKTALCYGDCDRASACVYCLSSSSSSSCSSNSAVSPPNCSSSICLELWHACADPLTSIPKKGNVVVYFPQGHLEQVASASPFSPLQMPTFDLPPQIFCKVVNVQLLANTENDEVYAQVTLVPQPELGGPNLEGKQLDELGVDDGGSASPTKSTSHMFCKTLTASDTSTHGGFSIPRRAAVNCFPPLDCKQQRPSQVLVAKDLHGVEWRFRHIYRGQPRRHLLTTGWSTFVSQKNLVAGDAVLFLRGEDGELRLGIRRAVRPKNGLHDAVVVKQNSYPNILSPVANAISTKSMFDVFYSPRASHAEFVIPYRKYFKSITNPVCTGTRFETGDSCSGVVKGIGDLDPFRWPNSKWRCLMVKWDEDVVGDRRERVSPWEIDPYVSFPPELYKLQTDLLAAASDTPITGGGGFLDFEESVRSSKVLQRPKSTAKFDTSGGKEILPLTTAIKFNTESKERKTEKMPGEMNKLDPYVSLPPELYKLQTDLLAAALDTPITGGGGFLDFEESVRSSKVLQRPKSTSKFDTCGGKEILPLTTAIKFNTESKERKKEKMPGEMNKLDNVLDNFSKDLQKFLVSKSEGKKFETIQGQQRSSLDLGTEDFHLTWPSQEEKLHQEETGKLEKFQGKKSSCVKEETNQPAGEAGESSSNIPSPCIFRTPFPELPFQKPELVSIGPYHMNEEHELDKYKHFFLEKHFFVASNKPERDLCFYVREILALEKQARACYSGLLEMSSREFVKMIVVDGCFIVQLLRHYGGSEDYFLSTDAINIIMPWQIPVLVQDFLLLENQIPFFVLDKLFHLSKNNECEPEVSLTTMALKFFDLAFPRSSDFISEFSLSEPNHLLDLFVMTIRPSNPWNISKRLQNSQSSFEAINSVTTETNRNESKDHISSLSKPSASVSSFLAERRKPENRSLINQFERSAAKLRQAGGIKLVPSRSNSFLDIKFKDGMLQIPVVTINNLFTAILVNSMALEYGFHNDEPKHVSNYIFFISRLIKNASDAEFLSSKGIISRFSDNDKKVADLFKLLRANAPLAVDLRDDNLRKTMREMNSYNGQSMRQFVMETSMVLPLLPGLSFLIICLFYLGYIPKKVAHFLATLICLLCWQRYRYWRHVIGNPVQVLLILIIISTSLAPLLLFLL